MASNCASKCVRRNAIRPRDSSFDHSHRRGRAWWVAFALHVLGRALSAQPVTGGFAQGTLGLATSAGGFYAERGEFTIEALVGGRVSGTRVPAVVMGLAVAGGFNPASSDVCLFRPGTGCAPSAPRFGSVATLLGVEARSEAGTLALMAGPGLFVGASRVLAGAVVRADLVTPSRGRFAFVLSPRVQFIPAMDGATFITRAWTVGLRLR